MPNDQRLSAVPGPLSREEPRILLVDDDPALLHLLTRWLSGRGASIATARNALEAITLMADTGPCEVVVVDHQLPGMSGLALLEAVRMRWPSCRRVLYTGHADSELVLRAVNHRVLTKQMDPYLVRDAILNLVKER